MSTEREDFRLVHRMQDEMMTKLRANRPTHGHWLKEDLEWLIDRLRDEVDELEKAVGSDTGDPWREAADVGNFAAMIADTRLRTSKRVSTR